MWNIVANRDKAYGVRAFVCDTDADLKDLPVEGCQQGSTVFVIATSITYMYNGSKEWVKVTLPASGNSASAGSNSGSESGSVGEGSDYTVVDGGTAAN